MTNSSSCSYVSKTENQCYNWFKVEGQEFTCYNFFPASTDLEWCLRLHNTSLQHDCCCCGGVLVYWLWGPSLDTYSCSRQKLPPPPSPPPPGPGSVNWWCLGRLKLASLVVGPGWAWTGSESLGPGWARLPHGGASRDSQSGSCCPTSQTPVRSLNKTKKTLHSTHS